MRSLLPACILLAPALLGAQDLPPYVPVNPVLAARSPLYAQPIIPRGGGWQVRTVLDYTNAIESERSRDRRDYLLDAELLQVDLWVTRNLSANAFVLANASLRGGYDGAFDGFLNWYHDLIGLPVPARNRRPEDTFAWEIPLPDGTVTRERPGTFIGDVRVGGGYRAGPVQLLGTITLPTTSAGEGWGREGVGASLHATARLLHTDRVLIEAGLAAGYTPTNGALAAYQKEQFIGGMGALRWRFWGQQALFATIWTQSPNWQGTGFDAMDGAEVTIDFGGLVKLGKNWPELQLGVTEDLYPRGPGVDVGAKIGVRW